MSRENRVSEPKMMKTGHGAGWPEGFTAKLIFGVVYNLILFGALLLLPAGTFDWPRAWVFLGLVLVGTVATLVLVFPGREDLLDERFKPPVQKGQPLADKIITLLLIAAFLGVIVFIPLDVFRFHLMSKPVALVSVLGLILVIVGWWIISLVFKENAFAAPVVKHQEERHQTVIDTGVYAIVRHPMYAGAIMLMVGLPLWLESYAAALLVCVPTALIVVRILFEERFLKRELKGYDDYMKRVHYRLIPFIW